MRRATEHENNTPVHQKQTNVEALSVPAVTLVRVTRALWLPKNSRESTRKNVGICSSPPPLSNNEKNEKPGMRMHILNALQVTRTKPQSTIANGQPTPLLRRKLKMRNRLEGHCLLQSSHSLARSLSVHSTRTNYAPQIKLLKFHPLGTS